MKNPPRHNLKSRKTEEAKEAAPPEKSSPLTDAIAAQRARPRRCTAAVIIGDITLARSEAGI